MKKSLFAAFMSALMLFVCGCSDKAETKSEAKAAAKQAGYDTAEAAAEACMNAMLTRDVNAIWAMSSADSQKALIAECGSEGKAMDYLKEEANEDSDEDLAEIKTALQDPEMKKALINVITAKCVVKVGDKYFIDLVKLCED